MTQAELAEGVGMSTSYISLMERNQRDMTLSTLEGIARVLTVPVSILVFLATGTEELEKVDRDLAARLSYLVLKITQSKVIR